MRFTEGLFKEIEEKKWDVNVFLEQLRNEEVVIWGTGLAGNMIYEALENLHIEISCFADNNREKIDTFIHGKKVLSIDQINLDAYVIIAANVQYGIHEQLCNASIKKYSYIDPIWLYSYKKNTIAVLRENADAIDQVYDFLTDDASRKVYRNVLLHRAIHDLQLIWEVYDEHQYFGNDIVQKVSGNFVDCGAFQGDTLSLFLQQIENGGGGVKPYNYYAFEADQNNYEILKQFCKEKNLEYVKPINLGVWDKQGQLYFQDGQTTGEVSGKVIENKGNESVVINVNSIDTVLNDQKIDFIKMDIEGAELKALQGACTCIKKYSPTLAISAYHELEHLWEIPLWIKAVDKNYDIYFGQHMWNMADTVCYGLYGA